MKIKILVALLFLGLFSVKAQQAVIVGGYAMYPSKNIMQNTALSKEHKTLTQLIKLAVLNETLTKKGPFTIFAPTDAAFNKLPKGKLDDLQKLENVLSLEEFLLYHIVPRKLDQKTIIAEIKANNGQAKFKTVQGKFITAELNGKKIVLRDEFNTASEITIANAYQSNGVLFVIDTPLQVK